MGSRKLQGNFDIYNILNASTVQNEQATYRLVDNQWRNAIQIMGGRLIEIQRPTHLLSEAPCAGGPPPAGLFRTLRVFFSFPGCHLPPPPAPPPKTNRGPTGPPKNGVVGFGSVCFCPAPGPHWLLDSSG